MKIYIFLQMGVFNYCISQKSHSGKISPEKTHFVWYERKKTKKQQAGISLKENRNLDKRERRQWISVCGWLQIKRGAIWGLRKNESQPDHRCLLADGCENAGWAAPAHIKMHQGTKRKHICLQGRILKIKRIF